MQRQLCLTQTGMSHILLTVEIFYIRPGMSGELLGNSSIQAAHIMTRLFYMQHRCIVVNLLAKAEGLNFTVETDCTAAQLQLLEAQKGLLDSYIFRTAAKGPLPYARRTSARRSSGIPSYYP